MTNSRIFKIKLILNARGFERVLDNQAIVIVGIKKFNKKRFYDYITKWGRFYQEFSKLQILNGYEPYTDIFCD